MFALKIFAAGIFILFPFASLSIPHTLGIDFIPFTPLQIWVLGLGIFLFPYILIGPYPKIFCAPLFICLFYSIYSTACIIYIAPDLRVLSFSQPMGSQPTKFELAQSVFTQTGYFWMSFIVWSCGILMGNKSRSDYLSSFVEKLFASVAIIIFVLCVFQSYIFYFPGVATELFRTALYSHPTYQMTFQDWNNIPGWISRAVNIWVCLFGIVCILYRQYFGQMYS